MACPVSLFQSSVFPPDSSVRPLYVFVYMNSNHESYYHFFRIMEFTGHRDVPRFIGGRVSPSGHPEPVIGGLARQDQKSRKKEIDHR